MHEASMCERIIEKMPTMTAEERLQLRRNCLRAIERSTDALIVQEAKRVLAELEALEKREWSFLARLPAARRIEYAFRRLPASDRERRAIRLLYDHQGAPPDYLSAVGAEGRANMAPAHRRNVPRSPPSPRRYGTADAATAVGRSRRLGGTADRVRRGRAIRQAEARGGDGVRESRLCRPRAAFGFDERVRLDATRRRISRSARFGW